MSNKENTKEEEIKDIEQEPQVEQNLEEIKKELTPEELIQQEKDKYLRLFAEFENYKKRTSRERIELFKTASQELMTSLLPIMDDFDNLGVLKEHFDGLDDFGIRGLSSNIN